MQHNSLNGKWATYYGDRVKVEDSGHEDEVTVVVWATGERQDVLRDDLTDISDKR